MYPRKEIDEKDIEIIKELRQEGRASYREIAEKLDVSPGTVRNRINELEEEGIIKGYHAVVDWDKLGYEVAAIIGIEIKSRSLDQLTEKLKSIPNVYAVYTTTGQYDLFIGFKCKSMQELDEFVKNELAHPSIAKTTTFIILDEEKEARTFLED